MKRSEAFHILEEMYDFATETQRQAIGMAQNDIEFVDLIPEDMVEVVRCKDCKRWWKHTWGSGDFGRCKRDGGTMRFDDFCSYGKRKEWLFEMDLRICFEVSTMENGEPCAFGMQVLLGETSKDIEYETLAKAVDVDKLIAVACLDTIGVKKEDVKIITPEEYDRLYGEDGDLNG